MVCPKCNLCTEIVMGGVAEDAGGLYDVQLARCRNPCCENFGKVVVTYIHPIKPSNNIVMENGVVISVDGKELPQP